MGRKESNQTNKVSEFRKIPFEIITCDRDSTLYFNGERHEGMNTPGVISQYRLYLNLKKKTFGTCIFLTLPPGPL